MHAFLLAAAILFSTEAKVWYGALLEDSGYGRLPFEQAAFLIQEKSGALTLAPWESRGHHHASYRGTIPQGTIAIVHTHPANQPQPSAHDRNEASRMGLPVVVVTPSGVRVAMP
jgi:hypothetical protein